MTEPIQADQVQPERVEWLWRERVPRGMLTIIGGRPDQGKGLLVTHIAAEVSKTRFVNRTTGKSRYGRVLYSAIEDSHGIMTRPRLEAAGAFLDNIDLWRFQMPSHMAELEAYLLAEEIDLLVIDPLNAHLNHGVSRHSDNIRKVLNPLSELIEQTRTAVVIIEHVLKRVPQSGHPIAAIGGSGSGVVAASRMAYLFGVDPSDEDRRVLACVKHNICEKPPALAFEVDVVDIEEVGDVPMLMFESEIEFDPMRMLTVDRHRGVGRPADKRAAACEWLTNFLFKNGPIQAGKVYEDAKQFGMTAKLLRRARVDMEVVCDPPGGGRTCKWDLNDDVRVRMGGTPHGASLAGSSPSINVDTPAPDDGPVLTDVDYNMLLGGEPDGK